MHLKQQIEDYEPEVEKKLKHQYEEEDIEMNEEEIKQALIDAEQIEDVFSDPEYFAQSLLQLEKHVLANQDLRTKYAGQPEKFVDSEVDLDDDIRRLTSLSAYPQLYKQFARSSTLPATVMLLQHQNNDISGAVINFFQELVSASVEEEYAGDLLYLYSALIKSLIFEAIVDCLERYNEDNIDEAECVHKCLSIIESMIEIRASYCKEICDKTKIMKWILSRIQADYKNEKSIDDNKLYASEILVQLLQNSVENSFQLGKMGGIDQILVAISVYRKESPDSAEAIETLENIFDSLDIVLLQPENQKIFFDCEGIQLMIKLVQSKGATSIRGLKTLALALNDSPLACKVFIDHGALKLVFPILLGKGIKNKNPKIQRLIEESCLSIIKQLIRYVQESYLERVISKFLDDLYINKIFKLRNHYQQMLKSHKSYDQETYLQELENGLSVVESCDIILIELLSKGPQQVKEIIQKECNEDGIGFLHLILSVGIMIDFLKPQSKDQQYYEALVEQVVIILKEVQVEQIKQE